VGTTGAYQVTIIRTCHDVNENTLVFCEGSSIVVYKSTGNSSVSSIQYDTGKRRELIEEDS